MVIPLRIAKTVPISGRTKLRTNTYGTRIALHKTKNNIDINCRKCGVQIETLEHILGLCIHTKNKRIRRHHEICDLIARNVSKEHATFREPEIEVNGDRCKLGMVIKDHDKVYSDVYDHECLLTLYEGIFIPVATYTTI